MKKIATLLLTCGIAAACESSTTLVVTEKFNALLSGAKVKPTAVQTSGSGTLVITSSSDTSALRYDLQFSGLSSNATAAHIHGPAVDTVVAGILVDFATLPTGGQGSIQLGTTGSATGSLDVHSSVTATVTGDSLFKLLRAGLLYVDVHTATNSAGEIRGQVKR
jgi:hypothetical protein